MGGIGANVVDVIGSACGFPSTGNKVKGKAAEVRVVAEVIRKKVLQGAGAQPLRTYLDRRQWRSGWPYGLFLTFV